jgi:hypothetical protein
MCYNKEISIKAFMFGIISSVLLIKFGNKAYENTNYAIGLFFIYISFAQLMEYFFWADIECKTGENKIATRFGPLLINLQPVVLSFILMNYCKSNNFIPKNIMVVLNALYVIYVLYKYNQFISNPENECTGVNETGHLSWKWTYDFNYFYYNLLMFLNFVNYANDKYIVAMFIIVYLLFSLSYLKFNQNIGELWCLLSTSVPAIILVIQLLF